MNHNEQKWLEQQQAAAELQYGATSWGDFMAAYKKGEATGRGRLCSEQDEISNVVMQQDQEAVDKYLKQLCTEQEVRAKAIPWSVHHKWTTPKAPELMKKACVACSHENSLFRSPSSAWVCSACDHFHGGSSEETKTGKLTGAAVDVKVDVDKSLRKQRDDQLRGMFT